MDSNIMFDMFGPFPNYDQHWILRLPYLSQKYFKTYKRMQTQFKFLIDLNLWEIQRFENAGKGGDTEI